jgi:hypothetical protein
VPRLKQDADIGLHMPGLYETLREKELKTALTPDPRLSMIDPDERERVAANCYNRYSPTALGQVDELLAKEPVTIPRYMLTRSDLADWPPFRDRRHQWFTVGPDDVISPLLPHVTR